MWHYSIGGTSLGPANENQLGQLIFTGQVNGETLVWQEGMAEWLPLSQTSLVRLLPPTPMGLGPKTFQPPAPYNPYQAPRSPYVHPVGAAPILTWKHILWSFEGRIARRHYWGAQGIWLCIFVVLFAIVAGLGRGGVRLPLLILLLLTLIPAMWSSLAIHAKRWHDRGMSGWMTLINLIPYVGGIVIFIICGCLRGDVGPNRFGDDPT